MVKLVAAGIIMGICAFLLIVPRDEPIPTGFGWNIWTFAVICMVACYISIGVHFHTLYNKGE